VAEVCVIDYPLYRGAAFAKTVAPRVRVTSAPSVEPVSVADMKSHLEVYDTGKDSYIGTLITAARAYCEQVQNRAYITQTLELTLDSFPSGTDPIVLPMPRLQSVTSVKYTPDNGVQTTMAASLYIVDTKSEPGRVVLEVDEEWPDDDLISTGGITIVYKGGYGDAATSVPGTVIHAIKMLAAAWFEQRPALSEGSVAAIPLGFSSLLAVDRVVRFP
jgi:uncharacterized phiE125 gp8 family phage protein